MHLAAGRAWNLEVNPQRGGGGRAVQDKTSDPMRDWHRQQSQGQTGPSPRQTCEPKDISGLKVKLKAQCPLHAHMSKAPAPMMIWEFPATPIKLERCPPGRRGSDRY